MRAKTPKILIKQNSRKTKLKTTVESVIGSRLTK
jgi:hypothetical protein